MGAVDLDETLSADMATQVWQVLAEKAAALAAAWDAGKSPPDLNRFLPIKPAALRTLIPQHGMGFRHGEPVPAHVLEAAGESACLRGRDGVRAHPPELGSHGDYVKSEFQ